MILNKSSNSWTKNRENSDILTESLNLFSNSTISKSSNTFSNSAPIVGKGEQSWNGDNLTSDPFGFDDLYSGVAYGSGEYGGIKHFENSKNSA